MSPSRSGVLPWLKMMTADAPAAWAFTALSANVHVPRWISAMFPTGNPAKSPASQPLVLARGGTRLMSTAVTAFATSPPRRCGVNAPVSWVALTGVSRCNTVAGSKMNWNGLSVTS